MDVARSTLNISSSTIDEKEVLRKRGYLFRGIIGEFTKAIVTVRLIVNNHNPTNVLDTECQASLGA